MHFLKNLSVAAALAVALAAAAPASAITYVGSRVVGVGSVELSVTTDDTLGVLGEANILDWSLHISNGIDEDDLFGPLSGDNSTVLVLGTGLSATATQLLWNFDAAAGKLEFRGEGIGAVATSYCLDAGANRCRGLPTGSEAIDFGATNPDNIKVTLDGVGVLGTA